MGRRGSQRPAGRQRPRCGRRPGRLAWLRADRGASAVELAILAPGLIFVSLLIVQFALWLDATHAALAAAQEGDRAARETQFTNAAGWKSTASQVALNYYHGLNTSVLSAVTVTEDGPDAANTVSVTVHGKLTGIFPLTISQTATGPVECFRTAASQGANCG